MVARKNKSSGVAEREALRIIGRKRELEKLRMAISLGRNVLIEGPVGVGKTFLVQETLLHRKKPFIRVDGDSRYTEQKLAGWFDPPVVIKKGYVESAFITGPLVQAMQEGTVLFINELNRMPEAVQNILLPAMDEKVIKLPKLGEIRAKTGFLVVATQNPREFTATHMLSEALLDRFEWIHVDYQTREEELEILKQRVGKLDDQTLIKVLEIVRATRNHPSLRRGASLRAALSIVDLMSNGLDLESSCLMALSSRVETISSEDDLRQILLELIHSDNAILSNEEHLKKKYQRP